MPNEGFFDTAVKTNIERINQKIMQKNGSMPTDILRSTIIVENPNATLSNIVKSFEKRGYKIWNNDITNRYIDGSAGYKDIAIKLVKGDNDEIVKEIQIMTPNMYKAKYELGGHEMYKQRRSIKVVDTETEQKARILEQVMDKLYDEAYLLDRAAWKSDSETSLPSNKASSGGKLLPNELTASMEPLELRNTLTTTPSTEKNLGKSSNRLIDNSPFTSSIA